MNIFIGDVAKGVGFPDTTFMVIQIADPDKIDKVMLCACAMSPDNFNPEQMFTVSRCREVNAYYATESEAFEEIRTLLHYIACHEVDEKITYKDEKRVNPHGTWTRSQRP